MGGIKDISVPLRAHLKWFNGSASRGKKRSVYGSRHMSFVTAIKFDNRVARRSIRSGNIGSQDFSGSYIISIE